MQALSPRLRAVLDLCSMPGNCGVLADIGADHGYLAIAAVQDGICIRAIACDLNPEPLAIGNANIKNAGLDEKIEIRLGNGLQPLLPGEADCIVIAGMGGMRIWGILAEGIVQAKQAKRLVLQPQHDVVLLRKKLHEAGFEIENERLVREVVGGKEHFYVILATRYAADVIAWTEKEYFLGKYLISDTGKDFSAYFLREQEKIEAYISSINDEKTLDNAKERLKWLKSVG